MTQRKPNDPVKKIFGKTAEEIFAERKDTHGDVHSKNAFCGNAGPEEMKHLQKMLDALTDMEIASLVDAVGIKFGIPAKDIDRDELEGVLDETDRETFYREYYRLIAIRNQ